MTVQLKGYEVRKQWNPHLPVRYETFPNWERILFLCADSALYAERSYPMASGQEKLKVAIEYFMVHRNVYRIEIPWWIPQRVVAWYAKRKISQNARVSAWRERVRQRRILRDAVDGIDAYSEIK